MDYKYYLEAVEHVIRKVHDEYKGNIIVTENGIATDNDQDRIAYLNTAFGRA